ncbi:MAG: hypothetical protein ACK5M3_15225 [Dysgonomonas sp.]
MRTILTVLFFLLASLSYAQVQYEPLELVKKILTEDDPGDMSAYYAYKSEDALSKEDFRGGLTFNFRELYKDEDVAVVNITLTDGSDGLDIYVHFVKEGVWKIKATRGLALTGIIYKAIEEYSSMTNSQIDSLVQTESAKEDGRYKSREDFDLELKNMHLIVALDDTIVRHFQDNKAAFESLKDKVSAYVKTLPENKEDRSQNISEPFSSEIRRLSLDGIHLDNYLLGCTHCLEFSIGGMVDNIVGYFYLEDKSKLPKPNPSRVIMVREIGNGWYMYKTT